MTSKKKTKDMEKQEEIEVKEINPEEIIENAETEILDEEQKPGLSKELIDKLEQKEKECEDYLDRLRRSVADFDNFRKRTIKEKENLYDDGFAEAVKQILPILDNFERAVAYSDSENSSVVEGTKMILKMFKETIQRMGVEEIPSLNEKFDPNIHNAIAHVDDAALEENIIIEVMQSGYKYKDKVLRYSMVKVAN
jgi:molecular chaperone GrpE